MKEKERKTKLFEIIVLIIAILVLLFCFWMYAKAREFKVKEEANIKPNKEDVKVIFSPIADIDDIKDSAIEIEEVTGVSNSGESVGEAKVSSTENGTIAELQAKFTKPGQEVMYTFYSHNTGKYEAYLDTITYANVRDWNFFKRCRAMSSGTNRYLVSRACEDISMVVKAGDNIITDGSITGIKDHKLEVGKSEKVTVIIKYDKNGTAVDGDFIVEFGSVTLTYLSKYEINVR